jgi:hypothetical protein
MQPVELRQDRRWPIVVHTLSLPSEPAHVCLVRARRVSALRGHVRLPLVDRPPVSTTRARCRVTLVQNTRLEERERVHVVVE